MAVDYLKEITLQEARKNVSRKIIHKESGIVSEIKSLMYKEGTLKYRIMTDKGNVEYISVNSLSNFYEFKK